MGREIKKVALDFEWPIGQIWKGFMCPYTSQKCKTCEGSGSNSETRKLERSWFDFAGNGDCWCDKIEKEEVQALIEAGRLMDFTHTPRNEKQREDVKKKVAKGGNSWLPYNNGYVPTSEEVNAWSRKGMGHDAINRWICVKARAKRMGVLGLCEICDGDGVYWFSDKIKELNDKWWDDERYEPPEGNGLQLWETVSEGSPKSPVFGTPEELARWLVDNKVTTFGTSHYGDYETWMKFIGEGYAPSMIVTNEGVIKSGVDWVTADR